jgi:hypothetical protein
MAFIPGMSIGAQQIGMRVLNGPGEVSGLCPAGIATPPGGAGADDGSLSFAVFEDQAAFVGRVADRINHMVISCGQN